MPELSTNPLTQPAAMTPNAVIQKTVGVSAITMGSRCLGFFRDMLIARYFGASAGVDAFLVAFKIPNLLRRLFGEGAFNQAFVPILCQYQLDRDQTRMPKLINHMAGSVLAITFLLVVILLIVAPGVVYIFAPGFSADNTRFDLATMMLRLMLPYAPCLLFIALGSAILNMFGYFLLPAILPWILNISLIISMLFFRTFLSLSILTLAWAVIMAGMLQTVVIARVLAKNNVLPRPQLVLNDPDVKHVWRLLSASVLSVIVTQINIIVSSIFASFLSVGSIAALFYAERLSALPLGVLAAALSTVTLPGLSRAAVQEDHAIFQQQLSFTLAAILTLGMPAAIGLALCSGPIVATLFYYGHFQQHDVILVQHAVLGFAFGIPALMLLKIVANSFIAHQQMRILVYAGILALLINILSNALLIHSLQLGGLALSTSLAAWSQTIFLLIFLWRRRWLSRIHFSWLFIAKISVALLTMALVLQWQSQSLTTWMQWAAWERILHLFMLIITGILSYLLVLKIVNVSYRTQGIP